MARLDGMFMEEVLSDNTEEVKCRQCEGCLEWGGNVWSSRFDKSSCNAFPYPDHKPMYVVFDTC